jgi:hypothetical protein
VLLECQLINIPGILYVAVFIGLEDYIDLFTRNVVTNFGPRFETDTPLLYRSSFTGQNAHGLSLESQLSHILYI